MSDSPRASRSIHRELWALVRGLVWLVLLLVVAWGAWTVISAHRRRTRGIPAGFPAPVSEANVPALGVNVALEQYDDQTLDAMLARLADDGFVWVRQSFTWSESEPASGDFDWSAADRVISALSDHPRLRLVAVLEGDPPAPPGDPDRFAAFAAAFARRYGDRVEAYQVWDEPNLAANWGGGPVSPAGYADLLTRTARAIRGADPGARILLAGLAPTTEAGPQNLSEVRYLERLYHAGAAPSFDVVAAKAYGFDTGPDDRRVDESILNFSRVLLLRDVMVEYGDGDKAIWISHWGWNALPEGWEGAASIWGQTDEATRAAWTRAALERARAEWPWTGAMMIENLQAAGPLARGNGAALEDPRWGFSLLEPDGARRPAYHAASEWARALPNAAPVGGYAARNDWAAYQGSWRVGPLGADPVAAEGGPSGSTDHRASFRFDGTRVALTVRRGLYRGFLTVTVDGEPANSLPRDEEGRAYVVLYDLGSNLATVPLAAGLEPGLHVVEVAVAGGQGEWPLVDWRVGAAPARSGLARRLAGLIAAALVLGALLLRVIRRIDWTIWGYRFLGLPGWGQVALIAGLSGLFWVTAGLTWRRTPSQALLGTICLIVSVATLPLLALLFSLRLDAGLALVAFSAPFYLVPATMFYRALGLPEVLVMTCAAAYGVRRVLGTRLPPWGPPAEPGCGRLISIDYAVGLLVLAGVAAGAAAVDRSAAVFELRAVFLLPSLAYALLRLVRPDRRTKRRITDALVLGGLGVALAGLAQAVLGRGLVTAEGGLPRLTSVYASPNSLGLYLGRVWPLLAAGALLGEGRRRHAYALALVPVTAALLLSFSRGALLLALPAAVVVMGSLAGRQYRWLAAAALLIGALVLVPLLRLPRFAMLFDLERGTTFFRLKLWRSSLEMIREHPWFGVGPGNFAPAYRTRYVLPAAWEEFNLGHPHNIVLDHWTRLGVLGLIAGMGVQIAFWREALRRSKRGVLVLGLSGGMAALLAHGLVDNAVFFPDLALAFFLTLALVGGDARSRGP